MFGASGHPHMFGCPHGRVWLSWKNWFWTFSTLGGCGCLERTDFEQFLLWEGVVVLKELILDSFYFGRVWWSWKKMILNSFYFGRVWLSWKNWFWTVSTLGGCACLEITDFEHSLLWEGVVVLKELILNSFYFGRVWLSWKNWFWTFSTLGGCGCLERTDFEHFLLWEGVVVLKEMILDNFYFGRVWWSWKKWFWTVSTLGGCGCLERTDFEQFLLWEGALVLKELILDSFYFGRVWWSWKNIWEMHREALGTYKGVFEHMDMLGHQGTSGSVWMHGASKHMGVSTQCPKM